MAHTRWADDEIRRILELRAREDLSWRELSEAIGEPVWRLRYWARRRASKSTRPGSSFVELAPVAHTTRHQRDPVTADSIAAAISWPFAIDLSSGVRVHVAASFDVEALRRLVSALETSC